jgi:hypothetical protein
MPATLKSLLDQLLLPFCAASFELVRKASERPEFFYEYKSSARRSPKKNIIVAQHSINIVMSRSQADGVCPSS